MKKIIKRVGLAGPALLMASLLVSCGGGGGGASSSFTPTNITTQSQAESVSQSLEVVNELVSLGTNSTGDIGTSSLKGKEGFLRIILKTVEDKDFSNISKQEIVNCPEGGYMDLVQTGEYSGYIQFSNCQANSCEVVNGKFYISMENGDNNIPDRITFVFDKGFQYNDNCTNSSFQMKDKFEISINGKLPNNDIYTEGEVDQKIKAEIVLNGGDVVANDAGRQSLAHFYNFRVFKNEVDNDQYFEYTINGKISYKDYCTDEVVNAVFETIQTFREYANAECPSEGKLVVNENQVIIEAYDPDNDPTTVNKIRISLGDEVIFDNDCTDLESLGVCPEP